MNYINEKILADYPKPIFIEETEIIAKQMRMSVGKIFKKDGVKGTGFFCKIPVSSDYYLPVFITNNHVIDEKYLREEKNITIKMNDGKDTKILDLSNKFKYTNKGQDISIIEIDHTPDIELLTLDENLKETISYVGKSIYILQYPDYFEKDKVAVSYGILKQIYEDNYNFNHYCSTEYGSSGSPILNLSNNKIIGIHKSASLDKKFNIGLFLYYSITEFINLYNNRNKQKTINKNELLNNFNYNKIANLLLNRPKEYDDPILDLINKLYHKGLIYDYFQMEGKYSNIILKKFVCSKIIYQPNWKYISKYWISAWHGTDFYNLESIVENGLKIPGTKLKNGIITQSPTYIPLKDQLFGIKNWENAIFASPSIKCALSYSDDIIWKGLVEVKINPNGFTKHKSKYINSYINGHPDFPEEKIDDIYRISSEKDIIVLSITFVDNSWHCLDCLDYDKIFLK
jgi:V8-like Glu-specific endopeptidase